MGTRPRDPAQYPPSAPNAFGPALGDAARRELLAFPAEYLRDLPVPVRVELRGAGLGAGAVVLSCAAEPALPLPWHGHGHGHGQGSGSELTPVTPVLFDAEEFRAIAIGVQSERSRPADFRAFCLRKRIEPGFRVTEELALDGARAERMPAGTQPWSLDRVLRRLELDPVRSEYLGADPLAPHAARAA